MKFDVTNSCWKSYPNACIIIGVFESLKLSPSAEKINQISHGDINSLLSRRLITGKIGQLILINQLKNFQNKEIILIGCGNFEKFNEYYYKKIVHKFISFIKNLSISQILFTLSELNVPKYNNYWKLRQTIEIFKKEFYCFKKFKSNIKESKKLLKKIIFNILNEKELELCNQAIYEELIISKNVNIAKDLGNMPPNFCTPSYLAKKSKKLEEDYKNINVKILNSLDMKKIGMNAYLAVGKGSKHDPVMPIITYQGNKKTNHNSQKPIVLIGKGLTFDTGGISIKPSYKMDEMKYDMSGASVVYAVMRIASELNLPLNIIGILALCENMIGKNSFCPGDILTTLSGKTIEILDTDAEGRLVLCDVLTYVERFNPSIVIDIATLTGACVIALGHNFSGLMSNDDNLSKDLIVASKQSNDFVWRLPLTKKFHNQLKSHYADMTNIGGSDGAAITAGCFLQKFSKNFCWAHLDIAGTAWNSKNNIKTSTGRPTNLLAQYLLNKSKNININDN